MAGDFTSTNPCWGPAESVHVGFGAGLVPLEWAGDLAATNPCWGPGESVRVGLGDMRAIGSGVVTGDWVELGW